MVDFGLDDQHPRPSHARAPAIGNGTRERAGARALARPNLAGVDPNLAEFDIVVAFGAVVRGGDEFRGPQPIGRSAWDLDIRL